MPKITKEQFAAMLNGRPLGQEMSTDEIKSAIASELVALLVSYDNIINIRGKIMVTERCFNNSIIGFGDNDKIVNEYSIWYLEPQIFAGLPIINITCTLKDSELTIWQFETKIPHAVFRIINGNGELQCGGIVMDYKDIYPDQATPETKKQVNAMHINTNTLIYGHIIQMPQPNESETAYSFVFRSDKGEDYNIAITADKIELLQEHKDCLIGIQCDCKQNTDTWAISDPVFNSMMPCDHSYDFEQTIARLAEQGGGWSEVEDVDAFLAELRGYDALITFENLVKCGFPPCSHHYHDGHLAYKIVGDYSITLDHYPYHEKAQVCINLYKDFDNRFNEIRASFDITTIPELQAAISDMLAANKIKFEFPVPIDTWAQITE